MILRKKVPYTFMVNHFLSLKTTTLFACVFFLLGLLIYGPSLHNNFIKCCSRAIVPAPYKNREDYKLKQVINKDGAVIDQLLVAPSKGKTALNRYVVQSAEAFILAGCVVLQGEPIPTKDRSDWVKVTHVKVGKVEHGFREDSPQPLGQTVVKKKKSRKKSTPVVDPKSKPDNIEEDK